MDEFELAALEIFDRHGHSVEGVEFLGAGEQSVCYGSGTVVALLSREEHIEEPIDRDIQDSNGYALQQWLTERATRAAIQTLRILVVGDSPRPYALMQRACGKIATNDIFSNETTIAGLFRKMGREVSRINTVGTEGFGAFVASGKNHYRGRFATWHEYIDYNINKYLFGGYSCSAGGRIRDLYLAQDLISSRDLDKIAARLDRAKEWTVRSVLTHYDNRLDNLMVDDQEVTLVDWGLAFAGVGIRQELIKLFESGPMSMDNPRVAAFLQGYGLAPCECSAAIEDGKLMLVVDGLVMSYGWANDPAALNGIRGWLRSIKRICDEW